MITVEKISEGIRKEGLNFGMPMAFIKLGEGTLYSSVDELVREVLMKTRCKWVCLLGESTTQVGMGTLAKGLSSLGLYTEVEVSGSVRDPGWLHVVDRWVVDYAENSLFNYNALRSSDMVRFTIKDRGDLSLMKSGFEELKLFSGTKYVKVESKEVFDEVFQFARKYERSRIYREA